MLLQGYRIAAASSAPILGIARPQGALGARRRAGVDVGAAWRRRCCFASPAASNSASPLSSTEGTASTMSSSDVDGSEASGSGAGKLKLMCLHGFMQTGDSFRMRIGSMRKALKSRVEFVFLDAPFLAADELTPEQIAEVGGSSSGRTWFKWTDQGPGKRPSQSTSYQDFDRTYEAMVQGLREHSPDGVFGFSQGATAAALLLGQLAVRQAEGRDLDIPMPRLALLCAGFLPRDPVYASLLSEAAVSVPSLFVLGDADTLVPPERTIALMDTFAPGAAALLRHPGAHMVPTCSGDVKRQMVEFLDAARNGAATASEAAAAASDAPVLVAAEAEAAVVA